MKVAALDRSQMISVCHRKYSSI